MSIAYKEGIKIPPPALNEIILAANQDIRQVIHNMSMWTAADKNMTYEQAKKDSDKAKKDMKVVSNVNLTKVKVILTRVGSIVLY